MFTIVLVILSRITVVSTNSNAQLFITAPNIFHLGVEETVSVIIYNSDKPVHVTVIAQDFPGKNKNLTTASGIFTSEKPGVLNIKLDPNDFPVDANDEDDVSTNRYALLVAKTNDSDVIIDKEAKVLVSLSDGVVFLQTDKPIYTPRQSGSLEYTKVKIRIMPLGFDFKPKKEKKVTVVVKNPQGIVVQRWRGLSTETGFITKIFGLSEFALIGNWTVLALHGHENTQNVSVKFEVKEYVLPKFSVGITGPKYILPNVKDIRFSIRARYTFGKPVDGTVIVKVSMVGRRVKAVTVRQTAKELKDGKADFKITGDDIKSVPGLPWFPEGRRLQIEADVIEKYSGKKESAIDNGIYFVKSPYKIERKATAEFFKPALPFMVKVDLLYPDKKPAAGVPMSISVTGTTNSGGEIKIGNDLAKTNDVNFQDTTDQQGRANFVVDVPGNIKTMKMRVETEKDDIPTEHNTFIEFNVHAYDSPSRTFLYVRAIREKHHFNCDVFVNKNASKITFMVIARGKILNQWVKVQKVGVISSFRFGILPEMSPSSRLVAFFSGNDGEVIADSVLLEIDDGLPNKVEFHDDSPDDSKHPGIPYKIQVSATPGTRVGLLAVDQSVYILRNREKLNKKRVFNIMKSLDLGCGVGSGRNSEDVFYKSGSVVLTNTDIISRGRSEFVCPQSNNKKKRSADVMEDLVECCKKGYIPTRASCILRVRYWMTDTSKICQEEFLRCCFNFTGEKDPRLTENRARKFQQPDDDVLDDEIISQGQIRKYFPETWIFAEGIVGQDGKFPFYANLPDTITTWVLQAVGISSQTGLGVARPLNIQTFKEFFVSLRLPYSVQRGEQLSVIATVYNYGSFKLKVKVKLEDSNDFCTNVPAGQKSPVLSLDVKENDAVSVSFPIVPIKLGKVSIKVIAAAEITGQEMLAGEPIGSDAVVRTILVVPEGVERRETYSFVLDPQGVLRDEAPDSTNTSVPAPGIKHDSVVHKGMQVDNVFLNLPSRAIPGSVKASMSLTGNLIGPVVTTLISGGLENLLHMPTGCGEQTMIFLAPNVYVMQYLMKTRQVTADIESRAYRMIQSGYQRALNYRRNDKSFSAFGELRPGSTWLTAFASRVFCAAQKFDGVEIDEALVCESVSWLLENQRQDGAFPEVKEIIHKSMMGGTHGDMAMTAFVLVSLLECGCHGQVKNKSQRIQNAVAFMERELDSINKVNILGLTTYALALAGSSMTSKANTKLLQKQVYNKEESTRYWDAGNDALNVETTAYALLAQMAVGRLKLAGPIVTWLTNQRDPLGGFVSTQDTCVALQALSKYSEKTVGARLDLRVSVSSEKDANWKRKYHVDADNALLLRQEEVSSLLGGEMFIDSSGSGVGQLQIEVRHNVPSPKNESCQFALKIEIREVIVGNKGDAVPIMGRSREKRDDDDARERKAKKCRKNKKRKSCKKKRKNQKHKRPNIDAKPPDSILLKVCARYLKNGTSGMTIMEVGIFSGFEPDKDSLVELMQNVRPTVDRFEISDRSVALYVSEISSIREFCATFKVNRMYDVGTVQPVPVKVYDYYKPTDSCTEFYSPNPRSALLAGICDEGYCRCSQDDCSSCVDRSFKVQELFKKACQEYDFAVIGEVILIDERDFRKQSWLTYEVKLQQIIKKRKTDLARGDIIEFKKRSGCRCPELTERKDYLIMGNEQGSFFVLDANSFAVPWDKKRKNDMLVDLRARVSMDPRCHNV